MNLKSRKKFSPDFQMASMTDLIFLLLIFFMLTSTLVSVNAMKLILPTSETKDHARPNNIAVSIDENLNYYVDQQKVAFGEIKGILKGKMGGPEKPAIVLNVEKSVPIDHVVQVMNIGYELKIDMVLATQQPE